MSTLRVEALEQPDGTAFVFNNKNLLINGSQIVWQRSTSASVSTDTYSTVDRWKTRVGNQGAFTVSRSTDVPSSQGFGYSTKWDCTTADASPAAGDFIVFEQRIEGQNLQHLLKGTSSAKKLTISFWIKTNKTGTYICELLDFDNTRNISKSFTISSSSTWEKITLTYDGDTSGAIGNDNGFSFAVMIWLGAGSDFTTGTLQTSWGTVGTNRATGVVNLADSTSNELYITGIQLEVGSTASGFEFEPYDTTERKCMRYYYEYGGAVRFFRADARSANRQSFSETREHPVVMRANPLHTFSGTPSLHHHWIAIQTGYSSWSVGAGTRTVQESIFPNNNYPDSQMWSFEGVTRKYNAEL